MQRLGLAFALVAFVALATTAAAETPLAPAPWPTTAWSEASPQSVGLDAAVLESLDAEFKSGSHGYIDGMLVIRHGRVVFERSYAHDYVALFAGKDPKRGPYNYYDPDWHPYYRGSALHTLQSVSKSVTSALVGVAIARGELPGVEVEVRGYFEGLRLSGDPRQARMTLRDLLTMSSGIAWDEDSVPYTDPKNSCAQMEASSDWVQFVLDQPMAAEPGQLFVYNSGVTQLIAQVLRQATGRWPDEYAAEQLFGPLGITRFYWKRTPSGLADAEGGLYLTPRDLAKLGLLFLRDGVWNGRRLLPEGWAGQSTKPHVATGEGAGRELRYGYQWWALPDASATRYPAWAALGYGGQRLIVVPELDLIAVFTGWNIYDKPALAPLLALDRLLAAVRAPDRP